jgi:hypothetical protein
METLGDDPKLMICKITVLPIKLYSLLLYLYKLLKVYISLWPEPERALWGTKLQILSPKAKSAA